jgi:hypothetical protein
MKKASRNPAIRRQESPANRTAENGAEKSHGAVFCPDCLAEVTTAIDWTEARPGSFVLLPCCTAVAKMTEEGRLRGLLTKEWWAIIIEGDNYDVVERRLAMLEEGKATPARR